MLAATSMLAKMGSGRGRGGSASSSSDSEEASEDSAAEGMEHQPIVRRPFHWGALLRRPGTRSDSSGPSHDGLSDFSDKESSGPSHTDSDTEKLGPFVEYRPTLTQTVRMDPVKLVFLDSSIEQRWLEIMLRQNIGRGARILLALNVLLGVTTLALNALKWGLCGTEKQVYFLGSQDAWLNFFFWLATTVLLLISLTTHNKHVYMFVVVGFTVFSCLLALPVLSQPCDQVRDFARCAGNDYPSSEVTRRCDLRAYTYMQEMMIWSLLTPWVIPEYRMMRYTWLWVWLFFLTASVHPRIPGQKVDVFSEAFDVLTCVAFLCGVNFMAIWKKQSLEKGQRTKFMMSIHEREASGEVYNILVLMLPDFVIRPMISSPGTPIADHLERVSVMFISLVDFDAIAGSLQPAQLLLFLNGFFTELDSICATHSVTKIETVGEVFVCAVGVTPDEQLEDREGGHEWLLARLVNAACDMLALRGLRSEAKDRPGEAVVLTIGIHTGPVVAGVVGSKLPRFRLFGDTMNMAARMMQTGEPGHVQLGAETRQHLPTPVLQRLTLRGGIEMKGVGVKTTYLLGGNAQSPTLGPLLMKSSPSARSAKGYSVRSMRIRGWKRRKTGVMQGLVAAIAGALSPEEHMTKFDQVVSDVSASTSVHPVIIFVAEEEDRRFYRWFYTTIYFRKIERRLWRQEIFLAALTATEAVFVLFVLIGYERLPELWRKLGRLRWFLVCRGICLALPAFWYLFLANRQKTWVLMHGSLLQKCLLCSNCLVAALMFMSYDTSPNVLHDTIDQGATRTSPISGISRNIHSLTCFPIYALVTMAHQTLFRGSFAFLLVAMALMIGDAWGWSGKGLVLPDLGRLLFVLVAVLQVCQAYYEEAGFRAQFEAAVALDMARHRIEGVLDRLMPPMVIQELRSSIGARTLAHPYADATILQADLCGFTKLARTRKPAEVVEMIGEIFGLFDRQADKHEVYKVETVGDAYIAAQAGPPLTLQKSPASVIRLGQAIIQKLDKWSARKGEDVRCRVGVHTGECIGGIVGTTMQRYHLFGEIMTCVDILESTSREGQVQVSSACKHAVEAEASELGAEALDFLLRSDATLRTSKGFEYKYERVGGPTYFASRPLRDVAGAPTSDSSSSGG